MPPRLNKRQQRELEELEVLGAQSEEDVEVLHAATSFSTFLAADEKEDTEDENEVGTAAKGKKGKKKKKKPAGTDVPRPETPISAKPSRSTPAPPVRNEKKALKKARAKEKKAADDELDKALAELSVQYPATQKMAQATPSGKTIADLLSVSLQYLDSEGEMRKFFGSKVVQANKSSSSGPSGSAARRQGVALRSNLTRPQPNWATAKGREGLSIRPLTRDEVDRKCSAHGWEPLDEKWWTVEYSKRYKGVTKSFMHIVQSGDPQGLWDIIGKLSWHADTLLQLSEVYRHREEYAQAVDFVDRALFAYERSFVGAFNFTSGTNRLDFNFVENRPFFLAVHRQVTDLHRRGCVRTAFEFARLLYSLDPWSDPHGSLLYLDMLATKSGMSEWLLDVYEIFTLRDKQGGGSRDSRLNPVFLPGWAYARALALWTIENNSKDKSHEASTAALREAVFDFPSIVPLLADKIDVSLPTLIRGHRDFQIKTDASSLSRPESVQHLLSHLYVQRSFGLWKERSSWFAETVISSLSDLPAVLPITERRKGFLSLYKSLNLCESIYRHVMVLEASYRKLFSFIPSDLIAAKSLACDPLPPSISATSYDEEFFQGAEELVSLRTRSRRQRVADERMLAQLIPDAAFRAQMQGFFDAHPNLMQRFPGGIVQFAQAAAQLPPEVLEELMIAEAMAGEGGMPGEMPGFDMRNDDGPAEMIEARVAPAAQNVQNQDALDNEAGTDDDGDGDDDDDEEEEEEEVSPIPQVIRNLLGRFWGRRPTAVEESSSDDDMLDNTGVD